MTRDTKDKTELKHLTKASIQRIKECLNLLSYSEGMVKKDIDLVRIQLELKLKKLESRAYAELKDLVQLEKDRLENIVDQITEIMGRTENINEDLSQNEYNEAILRIKQELLVTSADICCKRIKFDVCETLDKALDEVKTLGRCTFHTVKEENNINEHIQQGHITEPASELELSGMHADFNGESEQNKSKTRFETDNLPNLTKPREKGTSNETDSTSNISVENKIQNCSDEDNSNLNPLAVLRDLQTNSKHCNDQMEEKKSEHCETIEQTDALDTSNTSDISDNSEDEDKSVTKQSYSHAPTRSRNRQRRFLTLEDIQCKLGYGNRVDIANALWFGKEKPEKHTPRVEQRSRSVSPGRSTKSRSSNENQTEHNNTIADNINVSVLPNHLPACNEEPTEKKPAPIQNAFTKDVTLPTSTKSSKMELIIEKGNVHTKSDKVNEIPQTSATSDTITDEITKSSKDKSAAYIANCTAPLTSKCNIGDTNKADIEINNMQDTVTQCQEETEGTRKKSVRAKRLRNRSITGNVEVINPHITKAEGTGTIQHIDNITIGSEQDITKSNNQIDDTENLQHESNKTYHDKEHENITTLTNSTQADQNQKNAEDRVTNNKDFVDHFCTLPRRVSTRRRLHTGENKTMCNPLDLESGCDIEHINLPHHWNEFGQPTRSCENTIHQITESPRIHVYTEDISKDKNGCCHGDMSQDKTDIVNIPYLEKPTETVLDVGDIQKAKSTTGNTVLSKRSKTSVNKARLPSFDEMLFN